MSTLRPMNRCRKCSIRIADDSGTYCSGCHPSETVVSNISEERLALMSKEEQDFLDGTSIPASIPDPIKSPAHYQGANGVQAWDVIEAFALGFNLGNVAKYILRAGRKGDRKEDLLKARQYLDREIAKA